MEAFSNYLRLFSEDRSWIEFVRYIGIKNETLFSTYETYDFPPEVVQQVQNLASPHFRTLHKMKVLLQDGTST